jgi:hypothetical protein
MAAKAGAQHGLVGALDCRLREYDALESVLALRAGGGPEAQIAPKEPAPIF